MNNSDRAGFQDSGTDPNEEIESSQKTIQRRQFLGAAATLSGMPIPETDVVADGGSDDSDEDGDGPDYGRETVVNTSGGLEVFACGNHETKVTASSYPEGIGLKLLNGMGQMKILLVPEDIEPLCREVLDAGEKTRSEEVEYSREWITEDYRGDSRCSAVSFFKRLRRSLGRPQGAR